MTLLAAALEWAGLGVPVFPTDAHKRPLTANGHKDASTDPETVKALWQAAGARAHGIGAAMGEAAGLFAIDADLYKPDPVGGQAQAFIDDLTARGLLPPTRVHATVNGGVHYLFSSDEAWPNCVPSPGVEVKGEGGYIIVPPSPGYSIVREGIAVAPTGLTSFLISVKKAIRDTNTIDGLKQQILDGDSFHEAATSLSAKMAADGHPPERIQQVILDVLHASVASDKNHPRHSRWADLALNQRGELGRLVGSANEKFNPATGASALREAASKSGFMAGKVIPAATFVQPEPVVSDPAAYEGEWPFTGGYFGPDPLDVLSQEFVVYPILAENEVTIISAEPKAGKTLISQTIAMHLAAGADCGELKISRSRPVLYFALESQTAIRRRLVAWKKSVDPTNSTLASMEQFPFYVHERPVNLLDEKTRIEVAAKIAAADNHLKAKGLAPMGAIVFDTLTKAMAGGDQNSVEDTSAVFDIIQRIREHGVSAAIIFIHHDNKAGGTRGSGNIEAEPDTLLGLKANADTGYLELNVRMARSIEDEAIFKFKVTGISLGTTVQGYDLKAPIAIPVDETQLKQDEASSALRHARSVVEVLDEAASQGVAAHNFASLHAYLKTRLTADIYPPASQGPTAKLTVEWWKAALPTTGRICGDFFFQPLYEVKRIGNGGSRETIGVLKIQPAPGVDFPKTAQGN